MYGLMDWLAYYHRSRGTSHRNRCCPDGVRSNQQVDHCADVAYYSPDASVAFHSYRSRASANEYRNQWLKCRDECAVWLLSRTWLNRCWKAGLLCVFMPLLSKSAFSAYSVNAFHGGWYDVTSSPCKFSGESWRTGELATIGMPCIPPYPNFRPSYSREENQQPFSRIYSYGYR